jgi:hypothetical protein
LAKDLPDSCRIGLVSGFLRQLVLPNSDPRAAVGLVVREAIPWPLLLYLDSGLLIGVSTPSESVHEHGVDWSCVRNRVSRGSASRRVEV